MQFALFYVLLQSKFEFKSFYVIMAKKALLMILDGWGIGKHDKCEKFEGVVIKMYNNVFTVLVNGILKSFSYNDVFIGDVMIKEK